jgi:hypothetical protein
MATLLLDKSAFQALSANHLRRAAEIYQLLATDVLLLEVLGDIRHDDDRSASFARKLRMADALVNIPYHEAAGSELLGEPVPMTRVPVLKARPVVDSRGQLGAFVTPSEGDEALLRWSRGEFDAGDLETAEDWVSLTKSFDLAFFERGVRAAVPAGSGPRTLEQLASLIESSLQTPEFQAHFLDAFLAYLPAPANLKKLIEARWNSEDLVLTKDAPYTCHCLKVLFVLFGGVGHRLIGTRPTNFVDAQYFMYLPFCSTFASGDAVHRLLFPLFAEAGQELLSPQELRERLQSTERDKPSS